MLVQIVVMSCRLIQGVTLTSPNDSWDRLQQYSVVI